MERHEMIDMLLNNIKRMNQHKVASGEVTQKLLDQFVAEQRERYEAMTDMQLRTMVVMNFC